MTIEDAQKAVKKIEAQWEEMDFITTGDLKDLLLAAKALLSSAAATTATIEELTAERDQYRTYCFSTYCAFCGEYFPADEDMQREKTDAIQAHIHTCPKHPMREVEAERDRLITTLHKCQDELASMIGAHGTDTLVTEALRDVTEGLVKCRQERDEARDAAMFLLEFIPDGWPMPKGWEQAVRQARIQAKIYEPYVTVDEDDGYPD